MVEVKEETLDEQITSPTVQHNAIHNRKDFSSLPHLAKSTIVEHLPRITDLKNICLVSKELHEIAVRFLYKSVSLDVGCASDHRLPAFLNPRNKGLKHIRQIRLYLAVVADRCNQELLASLATRMILELLPEDILDEFSWCPWKPFSADNLLLLYKKQKKMKWLEVMDLDRDALPELKDDKITKSGIFESARNLALRYPENQNTMNAGGFYIEQTAKRLEELIIHSNFENSDEHEVQRPAIPARELNDTAVGPGLLMRTLFAHMLPFDACAPFANLTALRLHRVHLRHAADTWCRIVNFKQCTNLQLFNCPGADSLLGQLCKSANLPLSLGTLEVQHKDNEENETLIALDAFLCLVQGVRELIVDIHGVKSLPATAGICKQYKTLEIIVVHASVDGGVSSSQSDDDSEELVYTGEEFEQICKACVSLVELSCAWPATSLIRTKSDEWKQFENAVGSNLRQLVTLHISTFPNNKPSSQILPRHVYEHLLQGLATKLFDHVYNFNNAQESTMHGKLRLLAFGISDKIYEREDSKNQILYLRSTALDAEGNGVVHAAPVGWCLSRYIESRSTVLESVLNRESRPPVRPDGRDYAIDDGDGWDDEDE